MKLEELVILLPCYSLEDLSLDRDAREADELLSGWTSLFHPVLLSHARSAPKWVRADDAPRQLENRLILVPQCAESLLPEDWLDLAGGAETCVLRGHRRREDIVSVALGRLDEPGAQLDPDLVRDFFALGFCHFQVELLTRQLRYMSNLDEVGFERELLAAADAAVGGELDKAREHLRSGFELLTEAREYFYPVETYLLDLTLSAPATVGPALGNELAEGRTVNLLVCGAMLDEMAEKEPDTLLALRQAVEAGRATIIGGAYQEGPLPLVPLESLLAEFRRGLDVYQRHLGTRPTIFGRRRYGLTPILPQILSKLGFTGACHFTLDDGRFPSGNQSKVRWEGIDSTTIEALARIPVDASRADSFLRLPERLGDTMDLDHAATAVFAHWPGRASRWYEDLRRMAEYSPVLGRFVTAADYFRDTEYVGQTSKHAADRYRSPYLSQAIAAGQADPISRWVRFFQRHAAAAALQGLTFLAEACGGSRGATGARDGFQLGLSASQPVDEDAEQVRRQVPRLEAEAQLLARAIAGPGAAPGAGLLVINPLSFNRRVCADVSALERLPVTGQEVRFAAETDGRKWAMIDAPAMGFVWVDDQRPADQSSRDHPVQRRAKRKTEEPPLAEPYVLRNEFMEATVDPVTGAIRAVHDYLTRGSRLTQQIAFRFPPETGRKRELWDEEDTEKHYTVMAADEVAVTAADQLFGEIVSRGRLLNREGQRVAGYAQTARVQRGSRVIDLEIELDVDRQPGPDPWSSYYAVRFAWGDATADVFRSVSQVAQPTENSRLESPYFVEIRGQKTRTTILAGGLPYHHRLGLRKLDTLLVVRGETCCRFRLGVGIDLPRAMPAALDFLAPQTVVTGLPSPPSGRTGWLFHLGAKNVIATFWESKYDDHQVVGFRVRLLETEGRRVRTHLRVFRPVGTAGKFDLMGQELSSLTVEEDKIGVEFAPFEWAQVEADFV